MKLIDAAWTPTVNMLKIKCDCGYEFMRRSDRQNVRCPHCGRMDNLHCMRSREVNGRSA